MVEEIVVVVGDEKYFFKAEKLKIINIADGLERRSPELLIIEDDAKNIQLAVFQKWDLWKRLEKD